MAPSPVDSPLSQGQLRSCGTGHICSIVPPHLLQGIVDSADAHPDARDAAQRTLTHSHGYRAARVSSAVGSTSSTAGGHSIVPPHILQALIDSDAASPEEKERAQRTLAHSEALRADRKAAVDGIAGAKQLYRLIYSSHKTSDLPGSRLLQEGQGLVPDENADEVYNSFQKTFDFYYEVFDRNSIDDNGMNLIGSVHFKENLDSPGYDNAFWSDDLGQMIFGDGDQIYFRTLTKDLDVIAHELTHGVTSRTGILPYHDQSGALNESVSDVFGSMVKQYSQKQTVDQADWLIGASIFTSTVQGSALRSMKAPGTAYNDPRFGSDPQPATMSGYQFLSRDNDSGGVHINSGIPNYAFYLIATQLGGYSWERAGKIWYATLTDPELRSAAGTDTIDFKFFADLTSKHALELFDSGVQDAVKKGWTDVGVYDGLK